MAAPPLLRARVGPSRVPLPPPLHGRRAASVGHACLARLFADTGRVWGATAIKLRFYLAMIGAFVRQEPSPRTPGHALPPLNAVKPGGGLWVVPGYACLARLLADAGRVLVASVTKLRFYLAMIGAFVRQEPSPRTPGHVLTPLNAVKPVPGLWVVSGHAFLARLLADTGRVGGATATKLRFCLAMIRAYVRQEPRPRTPGHVLTPLNAVKPGPSVRVAPGHACLARLLADTGRVWGAVAGN
jgi:hypothetical protein